ncbi:MAG: electron transport complex subunit RsxC [Oscillospiraceae bacterium]|nr:electron transport complex subunit RsxC [Oscillospiraceae bacterium]
MEVGFLKRLNGVHVPHKKYTAIMTPVHLPTPDLVIIPMSMHIGAPAKPVIKAGDHVKAGQLLAEAVGVVSSPVYSSVSGTVIKLDEMRMSNGQKVPAVIIETDDLQTVDENIHPPVIESKEDFLKAVRDSGVVGLGGAGFPAAVKLTVKEDARVDYLLVNGAECEPYITSDTRTMLDNSDLVMQAAELVRKYLKIPKVVFGIEENKPECIEVFRRLCEEKENMSVCSMPALYPQGGEKVLIYNITGREVPEGKLPLDVGCIVMNCTSLAAIAKYVNTGMPLIEKCVTVDGSAVRYPQNVITPIGTPVKDLFTFCGGFRSEARKMLYGGPMMGIALSDPDLPVLKSTNAVLAFDEKDSILPEPTACIRCGTCVSHCPMRLAPLEIERAFQLKKPEILEKQKVNLCMECGCCAYGCPAKRPLVQVMKLSKSMLREYQNRKKQEQEKLAAKEAEK